MVKPFQFSRLPLIWFGNGKSELLPGLIKRYGTKIILVTGERSFRDSEKWVMVTGSFLKPGIEYLDVKIPGEPSPEIIDDVVRRFSSEDINAVVGIGGGSVLDAGKAISAMMYRDESVRGFLEGVGEREHPVATVLFI